MDRITPEYEPHAQLGAKVALYLKGRGFFVEALTYHDRLPKEVVSVLQNRYTPTALYLRGKADRIAVHQKYKIEFEWEVKTHSNTKYQDMTIEGLPLVFHILKSPIGVKCLYACAIPHISKEFGFWIHELPPIREIRIPTRWESDTREWYKSVFRVWFPKTPIIDTRWSRGTSGDPYLIIAKTELANCISWKELVDTLLPDNASHQGLPRMQTSQIRLAF